MLFEIRVDRYDDAKPARTAQAVKLDFQTSVVTPRRDVPAFRDRREVLDAARLTEALNALVEEEGLHGPELRAAALSLCKSVLADAQLSVRERFEKGLSGRATSRAIAWAVDQLIRSMFSFAVRHVYPKSNPTAGERISVIAVGGYGRGEMAPYSDVDLLSLFPYRQTPWGEQVVEYLLYMLWDLGLKVGNATRSADECMRLAQSDITIRTGLLEARYLCGDAALYRDLRRRFRKEIMARTGPDFVEAKLAERDQRHKRFGDSRYVVEPNIKEGKGGLRDLHTLFWIGKYAFQVPKVADLVDRGVLTQAEFRHFAKAEEYLWAVRCHLHYLAGRAEERLTFDAQPEIGQRMRYTDRPGSRGVERFMKHYYLVAKEVGDLTRIFCAALEEQFKRKSHFRLPRMGQRLERVGGFVIEGGRIDVVDDDLFQRDPVSLIRLFHESDKHGADIHPRVLRLVTRSLHLIDASLRENSDANQMFLEILTSRRDPETTLRRMNEAGVLGRFVPDFGRVVAQMQHDMYHVYTVDEHTIRAIGMLSKIEHGSLEEDLPLSNEIIHKIQSRPVLFLAVLLHDIAKGRGGDHSEIGADIAHELGPRVGLSDAETETVAWLVRHHLAMSSTAFKRDIQDPKTVSDFAALVQSPERLKLLLVLTVADIRAVGPAVWNGWKGQLLRELYHRTEEALSGGASTERAVERVAAAQEALRPCLPDWPDEAFAAYLDRGQSSYWLSTDTETLARHAELVRRTDESGKRLAVDFRSDAFHAVTEVTIYTQDHHGLFALMAGAMAVSGVNIVEAKIFTTNDGMALDTFWVQDVAGGPLDDARVLAKLESTIESTLMGVVDPDRALARQVGIPSRTRVFEVTPRVIIDNTASHVFTVIEVNARDRRELLYDVTGEIAELGLSIATARVATYGESAVDVFYVKDVFGLKVTHDGKVDRIRTELMAAIAKSHGEAVAPTGSEDLKSTAATI